MNKPPTSSLLPGLIIAITFAAQFLLLAKTYPLAAVWSGFVPLHIDHPFHLYQIELGRELLKHGQLVGYDPFFGAGNLGGVTFNVSAKLPVLISALVPGSVLTEVLYSSYVFLCALIAPVAIAGAVLMLKWPRLHQWLAAIVGLAFWWIGPFRWYHSAGLVSFVCASYLAIFYATWVFTYILASPGGSYFKAILAGALGGAGLWLHPLFGIVAGIPLLILFAANWRDLKPVPMLGRAAVIGLMAIVINLPWILAMSGSSNMADQPYQRTVGLQFLVNAIIGIWSAPMGSFLNPLVVAISTLGLFFLRGERVRVLVIFLTIGYVMLLFAAFGAALQPLATLQPNRFLAPGFLIIGLGAAYTLGEVFSWLKAQRKIRFKIIAACTLILVTAILAREIVREITPGPHGHYGKNPPEITPPPDIVNWLEASLQQHTTSEGRILFETSLARTHGGSHIAGYLALRTKREFIGGAYPFFMPQRSFWDHVGFGRSLADLSNVQLTEGLDLYNVGWVLAHSDELAGRIAQLPQAYLLAQRGNIRLFSIDRPLSYFHSGKGQVVARGFDRLEVLGAGGTDLVMRYHWTPGLSTTPPAHIEPISLSPDFPPFIRILNAPEHFVLHTHPSH